MPHRQRMDTSIFLDQVMIVGQIPADMKAGETKAVCQTPSLDDLTVVKDPWVVASEDLMLHMVVMALTWGLVIAVAMTDQLCTWYRLLHWLGFLIFPPFFAL